MARGDRFKAAKDLQPGDRVRILLGGYATIQAVRRSHGTMVKRKARGPNEPDAIGLIVIFELIDGPKRGLVADNIIHPEDKVLIA